MSDLHVSSASGADTHNTIRNNSIRDNSRTRPGALPGIVITASREGGRKFMIENNIGKVVDERQGLGPLGKN